MLEKNPHSLSRKWAAVLVWILLVIALQEAALRFVFPLPELRRFNRIDYKPLINFIPGVNAVRSVRKIYRSRPDDSEFTLALNQYGFRDRWWKLAAPRGTTRVMFVGDSFVEGVMVATDDTIPRSFERLADKPEKPLETMNFGVAGVGLDNYVQVVADAAPWFKPDWVVLVLFANDFAGNPPRYVNRHIGPWGGSKPRLLEVVRMLRERELLPFRWSFRRIAEFQPVPHPNNPLSDPEYERGVAGLVSRSFLEMMKNGSFNPFKPGITGFLEHYLREPIDVRGELDVIQGVLAASHGRLLVTYLPERRQISNYYKPFEQEFSPDDFDMTRPEYQRYQQQLAEQCAELEIPFLDLTGTIAEQENRGNHLYWRYDDHLTAAGSRAVAGAIYAFWSRLSAAGIPPVP